MKLSEYIKVLQEFAENNPDLEVCMTEGGYYSQGPFAELYDTPVIKEITDEFVGVYTDGVWTGYIKETNTFIVLGHSQQNY